MTPADLAAIRERAHESPLGKSTTRMLDQAILDRRALLKYVDTLIRERDSYCTLQERIEQKETP